MKQTQVEQVLERSVASKRLAENSQDFPKLILLIAVSGTEYWARWTKVHPPDTSKHSYCPSAEVSGLLDYFCLFQFGFSGLFGCWVFLFVWVCVNGFPRMTLKVPIYELDPYSLGYISFLVDNSPICAQSKDIGLKYHLCLTITQDVVHLIRSIYPGMF